MKTYIYTLFSLVIFFSCEKANNGETPKFSPNYWGEATAQKNGSLWQADPVCRMDIVDSATMKIQLDSFVDGSFLKESLVFKEVPPIVGNYDVFRKTEDEDGKVHAYLYYWQSDVPLGVYHVLEGSTNRLVLESFDNTSKEIKGSFDLTLIVDHRPYPTAPDTIRFTNGKFHGRLYK